ncbi:MAG TPA: Gfo/Idh/MocA family oxidoreductase [Chitinophagaceae bacterium]|nr:Gfo/Idh/MocA family oxidoreductase [Chitinophagaceae bacterium]
MEQTKTYKWGIIGPGKIAQKFAAALSLVPGASLYAVASRDIEKAAAFAAKYKAPVFYNTYEALAANPEIDAVYIATPHTFHHAHTLLCLRHKKAVLCEKPMSVSYESTLAMVNAARENKTFLMEAMWSRFLPIIEKTRQLVQEGAIGTLKYLRADFGFAAPYNEAGRLYNLSLGGGSLLDVGVYPLFFALWLMGKPDSISSVAQLARTGADEIMTAVLKYSNGSVASIASSINTQLSITAELGGTEGAIFLDRPWYKGSQLQVRKNDAVTQRFSLPYGDNGFEFQVQEVHRCLGLGLTESDRLPLSFSLLLSSVMDEICRMQKINYSPQGIN